MNGAAMNTCLQVLLWTCVFISLEMKYMLRSRVVQYSGQQSGSCSKRREGDFSLCQLSKFSGEVGTVLIQSKQ